MFSNAAYMHIFQRIESIHAKQVFSLFANNCQLFSFLWCFYIEKKVPQFLTKINKSWFIALTVVSRSIKKSFSIDCINIYFFSIFSNRFCLVQKCGVTSNFLYTYFFIRKIVIRKQASKTPKPEENVKKMSSLKYLSCNF